MHFLLKNSIDLQTLQGGGGGGGGGGGVNVNIGEEKNLWMRLF